MTEGELHIEQRELEPGRSVVVWPGRRGVYAAYDPSQISERQAVAAIRVVAPGVSGVPGATRAGDGRAGISVEGIAEHGRFE